MSNSIDMPITSPRTIGLDLEDFRRLGVRPNESRASVIRRAAARSAKGLAEKQLARPSEHRSKQLSRVATSAYRLLDPRRRQDVIQRVHVGRILPNTLSWAAQTKFYDESGRTGIDSPFSPDSLSDSDLIEMLDLDAAPRLHDELEPWTTSLRDGDLLKTSPWLRRVSRVRSQLRYSLVLLVLAGVAIGTVLGFATLGSRDAGLGFRSDKASSAAVTSPGPEASGEQMVRPTTYPEATEPGLSRPENHPIEPTGDPSAIDSFVPELRDAGQSDSHDSDPGKLETVVSKPPSEPPVEKPVDEQPGTAPPPDLGIEPETTEGMSADSEGLSSIDSEAEAGEASEESDASGDDGFLSDPFVSPKPIAPPPEMSEIEPPDLMVPASGSTVEPEPTPSDGASIEAVPPTTTRHAVPVRASTVAARTQLISLLPQLASAVRPQDAEQRIAEIEALESDLTVGSADFWTARMMVAEIAWLVEDVAHVSDRLQSMTANYDVPLDQTLSESFTAACGLASLPGTHQHLVDNGLRLANQLIIAESFQPCRRVVDAMEPLAESLESDTSIDYLQQFSQALDQLERLAESSKRTINESGDVDTDGDVGIAGRYHCLMLRRWDVGLSWLAEASDPRIASLARRELKLADAASGEELIALSQRWFAAASRSSGHVADSMRLHAIDILRRARSEASGLKKLEMDRLIDVNQELLPSFLRESPSAAATEDRTTPSVAAAPVTDPETLAPEQPKNGLRGRIEMDGQDIGVQLDYELDVPMTQAMLERIADRLNRTRSRMSIRLVGEIELDETSRLLVSIAEPQQGVNQRVEFDDTKLEFDPLENTAKVTAGAGKHQIVWTIEAEELSRVFLRLHDGATGRRLHVVQPSGAAEQPTALTVAMVRGAN